MTSLTTSSRLILVALIVITLLPDQIHHPLNKKINNSLNRSVRDKQNIDLATRSRIEQVYGKSPMRFEVNEGQADPRVKFTARGPGYALFLTGDEAVLHLRKGMADQPIKSTVLRMKPVGSNRTSRVSGTDKLQSISNYFIGNNPAAWRKNVVNYSRVKYDSLYPGIDLVWYGNQQLLEHDFIIAAGADPGRIKLSFSGADDLSIDAEGALVLRTGGEALRLLKPHAWQESNGSRQTIACNYRISETNQIEFRLGDYDAKLPLVIDPALVYSTYIGGIGTDSAQDIAVDGEGAAYITGQTSSADFPGPSPIQQVRGTLTDAYVLKINPAGNAVVFGTWIGGNGSDSASTIAIDPQRNVYLAGTTNSSNFPLQNALQASLRGLNDAFALKLDSSGSMLLYSTYIGGTGVDAASALAVDGNGAVYLTGSADSGDFPVENAFQPAKNGSGAYASDNGGDSWGEIGNGLRGADANELVISSGDSSTIFAGTDRGVFKSVDSGSSWNLLGGDQFIRNINQVILDPSTPDILYAVSAPSLFKSTDGGATWVQKSIILRTLGINPITPATLYAGTFNGLSISTNGGDSWTPVSIPPVTGGSTIGQVEAIAFDPITPSTIYIGATQGIYKSINGGATWVFAGNGLQASIVRIAISRSNPATLYAIGNNSTIYKSINAGANWSPLNTPAIGIFSSLPWPLVVSPDNPNLVYVGSRSSGIFRSADGGTTWNTVNNGLNASDIRALVIDNNSQGQNSGRLYAGSDSGTEAFVAKLDATGSSFVYSSYLGGGASETGAGIVVDSSGAAYLAGFTNSANFPAINAFQPTIAGQSDAFVAKVNESGSALSWATFLGGNSFDNANGIALSTTGDIYVAGVTLSSNFPVNNAIQASLNGSQDGFITRLKNDGSSLVSSTYLGGTGFETVSAVSVDTAGAPYVTGVTNSSDFPVINAVQSTRGGTFTNNDAFVTKLSMDGTSIVFSTYLGGSGSDQGNSITVDTANNIYVTGNSSSGDFPTIPFPLRTAGPSDAFITKIGVSADLAITISGDRNPVMINNQHTYTLVVTHNGVDPSISTRVTDALPAGVSLVSAAASQGSCSGEREINCELGNLVTGSRVTITIIITPTTPGTITNNATVTSGTPDSIPANNTATLETAVSFLPSIYGRVTNGDGNGLGGVSIALNGSGRPPVPTFDDGNYQFSEVATGGSYVVTPSRQGYVFNPPNRTFNNLQSDQRADYQGVACNLSIQSASRSFPATGGEGSVTITSPDPQCQWTAQSNAPWIKLISAPAGNGSAIVSFRVEPAIGSRAGNIKINGTIIPIFQEFNACPTATFNLPKYLTLPPTISEATLGGFNLAEDFNNDSVSDLVYYISQSGNRLHLALSNSSGGYDDGGTIYSGAPIRFVRAADLNNDGKKDIALSTLETPRQLVILTGNGAGGFSPPVEIETGPSPIDLAIDDFNNDGSSDLAVLSDFSLAIHLGDGAGGFTAPNFISLDLGLRSVPSRIQIGDFNGDGNPDIIGSSVNLPLLILYGDGAGVFSILAIGNISSALGRTVVGDFNGDLKTDIAIKQFEPTIGVVVSIYVSTPTGELQRVQTIDANRFDPNLFDSEIFAGDFNGDGKSDLGLKDGQTIGIIYAQGDYTFGEPAKYHFGGLPFAPLIGDFKADGLDSRTDLFILVTSRVAPTPPSRKLVVLSANRQGEFAAPRAFEFVPPGQRPGSSPFEGDDMKSGDLNGDGVLDLVIATATLDDAALMLGNGRGEFGAPVSINSGVTGGRPVAIEIRDFNHDGKADLALVNAATQNLVVLLNNGQGGFTQSAILGIGTFPKGLASADFNNDGHLDLVAKAATGGLALFLGNGQGGFIQSATGLGGADLVGITFTTGDFNGDGLADLALSDDRASFIFNIVLLPGNGQGGFGDPVNLRTEDSARAISVSDLNLDGRDDLVYTQFPTDAVFVILSNPEGGFAAPIRYQTNFGFDEPQIKDFNGDGKQDLIVGGSSLGTFSILLGNGDGSFNQASTVMDTEAPFLIATGDFDEDGSLDLAAWRSSSSTFGVLLNRSMCAPSSSVVPVSAASNFRYRVARNSIVSLLGENLATTTRAAIPPFLPTSLANTRVRIKDNAGRERLASLYSVSPDRITLLIPAQTSPGVALITVTSGSSVVAEGTASIAATAPGLFSADLTGQGYAAALVLRIRADGRRDYEPVVQFDFEQNRFVAVPIDLSNETEQVFLLLSGTGIRNFGGLANVKARIGGENAEVTSAGSEGILPGLDQVKVRLQPSLQGGGEVAVELSVEGRAANSVRVKFK